MADNPGPSQPPAIAPAKKRNPRPRNRSNKNKDKPVDNQATTNPNPPIRPTRAAKFNTGLTNGREAQPQRPRNNNQPKHKAKAPEDDTLSSSLAYQLRTPPYPDCVICFNAIRPEQAIWSCNPFVPIAGDNVQYCWSVLHLRCIKEWARKSKKEYEDALRNRGEHNWKDRGEWRCPGCQGKRQDLVHSYRCFCGQVSDPSPPRLATPHSCGSGCSRPRERCAHPCPLSCHPGPCPPCKISVPVQCSCPKAISGQLRCAELSGSSLAAAGGNLQVAMLPGGIPSVSCGSPCSKVKECGNSAHRCERTCHEGPCDPCTIPISERCSCSKSTRIVECESRRPSSSPTALEEAHGTWACATPCDFPFSCGHHACTDLCHSHPPSSTKCPMDPYLVTTCPCGKSTIAPPEDSSSSYTFPARRKCQSPIPTCTQSCLKTLSLCGHICARKCHKGSCEPCSETVVRPCRCGGRVLELQCSELYDRETGVEKELLCERPCPALRSCGRHECRRVCCPLANLALGQGKKGKGRQQRQVQLEENDPGGLHLVSCRSLYFVVHQTQGFFVASATSSATNFSPATNISACFPTIAGHVRLVSSQHMRSFSAPVIALSCIRLSRAVSLASSAMNAAIVVRSSQAVVAIP